MSSDRHIGHWALGLGLLGLVACADVSRGEASPVPDAGPADAGQGGTGGDGSATLSFAADVYGLLVPSCQRCHAPGAEAGDTALSFTGTAAADHATVLMFVDTSAPSSSRLLAKMSGNGHGGGAVYAAGSPEYLTVLHWIQQGAPP